MRRYSIWILVAVLLATVGCSWHARKLFKVEEKIGERVKENVQIADEALNAQPEEHKTRQTDVASQAVHDAAVLSGYPLEDQRPLVAGLFSSNAKLRKSAEEAWASKRKSDQRLRTVQMHQLRELQKLGAEAEAEKNQNIVSKFKNWGIATFGVGGFIALLFLCPGLAIALLPLVGNLFKAFIRAVPKAANWLGVVGVDAYDAVVKGIEAAKIKNPQVKFVVEDELSKEMDATHKALVLERKIVIADKSLEIAKAKSEIKSKIAKTVDETEMVEKGSA